MSYWTYIHGAIEVHVPERTQAECTYILQTVLDHLPKVYGSEGDMEIYVNQKYGFNSSCSHDEFFLPSNLGNGDCGDFEYQTMYLLTVSGRLRDVQFEQTLKILTNGSVDYQKDLVLKKY